jgi:hypothetical protein
MYRMKKSTFCIEQPAKTCIRWRGGIVVPVSARAFCWGSVIYRDMPEGVPAMVFRENFGSPALLFHQCVEHLAHLADRKLAFCGWFT